MTSLGGLLTPYVLAGVRRRQALTIAALLGSAQYLVRVYTPAQLRVLAWAAVPESRAIAIVIVWLLWMRVTRAGAWRLVIALDVRTLRHLPIAPRQWRITHTLHLLALDVLLGVVTGYALWPMPARDRFDAIAWWCAAVLGALTWRVTQCAWASLPARDRRLRVAGVVLSLLVVLVLVSPGLALASASLGAAWAWTRLGHPFAEPHTGERGGSRWHPRHAALAIAGLWLEVARRQDGGFVRISALGQLAMVALSSLACVTVGVLDPPGAAAAVHLFAIGAAGLATWSAVRVERRIAVDRWALDPWLGSARVEVGGRLLAAGILASPLGVAAIGAALVVDHGFHARSLITAAAAMVWSAAATLGIVVRAQQRDRVHEPPILAQLGRLLAVGIATAVFGPGATMLAAAIELGLAWHRWPAADAMRRRRYRAPGEAERE